MASFNDAGLMLQAAEQGLGIALARELLAALRTWLFEENERARLRGAARAVRLNVSFAMG